SIYEMAFDENGNLWLATDVGALERGASSGDWEVHNSNDSYWPDSDYVNTVVVTGSTIWFGTDGGGAVQFTPGASPDEWVVFTHTGSSNNEICSNNVNKIVIQENGNAWFGTDDGLCRLDTSNQWTIDSEIEDSIVRDLAIDAVGNVWTVRPGFGITVIPPTGSAIHYTEGTGTLTDNDTVWSIFIDSEQRKWIGFLGNGIDVFSPDNQQRNNVTYDAIEGDVVIDIV